MSRVRDVDRVDVMTHLLLLRPTTGVVVRDPVAAPHRPGSWLLLRLVGREVLLVGALLAVYQASRLLGGRDVAAAFDHAGGILRLQQRIGLPSEQQLQALVLSVDPVVQAANAYYAAAHVPVTLLSLLWLLLHRPAAYRRARNALISATAVALVVYLLVPVAPPRMLAGFVDTAAVHGQSVYGDPAGSVLANQYAALPSLHVGWALLVAVAWVAASRSRWRWLWLAHPAITVLVVVVTANHFWLDAVAGALVVMVAWWGFRATSSPQLDRPVPGGGGADVRARRRGCAGRGSSGCRWTGSAGG
jgi:hypothetical protein